MYLHKISNSNEMPTTAVLVMTSLNIPTVPSVCLTDLEILISKTGMSSSFRKFFF